jgi:D-alanyl-lipoteichoic acid acyltransferase DltB (MBOAT superfamily)
VLFNSYAFIAGFVPAVLIASLIAGRAGGARAVLAVLLAASVFFYAWWDPRFALLLGASIAVNFGLGLWLASPGLRERRGARHAVLIGGITFNLALIAYFKYADFAIRTANAVFGSDVALLYVVLPLGISFFTFQQVAYLVDVARSGVADRSFISYALFVTFFPQLIAGPIVHHGEMMPQFRAHGAALRLDDFAAGITMFAIGLFKKAVLADGVAPYATAAFAAAEAGETLDAISAWGGALAYTVQLYFDFSGYCDMAVGAARLFGIRLPANFDSPYKATSIQDFWRRWHMTLSRFLRDYVYIPLGGNRRGAARRHVNVVLTMLIGGLWHGASWTFVVWGGLHGLMLALQGLWQAHGPRRAGPPGWLERRAAHLATFLFIVVSWVFFRAPTFDGAAAMLEGMAGLNGVELPSAVRHAAPALAGALEPLGVRFTGGGGSAFIATWAWVGALLALALLAPNSQQILWRARPVIGAEAAAPRGLVPVWSRSFAWACATGLVLAIGILALTEVSEFLYFQF